MIYVFSLYRTEIFYRSSLAYFFVVKFLLIVCGGVNSNGKFLKFSSVCVMYMWCHTATKESNCLVKDSLCYYGCLAKVKYRVDCRMMYLFNFRTKKVMKSIAQQRRARGVLKERGVLLLKVERRRAATQILMKTGAKARRLEEERKEAE